MSNPWQYFKSLFKASEESSPSNPFLHELIIRSEAEKADYEKWKDQLVRQRLSSWLQDQYILFRLEPERIDESIDFLHAPSSKGFAIHFSKMGYALRESRHFLDFLKEQVRGIGYRNQISDTRTYQKGEWVETIERHYLKPKPDFNTPGKFKQVFGNIRIELKLRDEQPFLLTFSATTYNDSLFDPPKEFDELMAILL
ncbi:MAG: hypothetical protein KDC34_12430 [Saprospiraceae bacterium]|nr:hypothetical protein [Saprospiraceae bacterium]